MADRKPQDFVHLHVHADTSLLDGFGTIPEMVAEAARIGQKAIAITDHGNMHGVYDLYTHATAAGLKPIAGIEAYMAPSIVNRKHRGAAYFAEGGRGDVSGRGAYTHITLLAENNEGLHNLYKMGLLSYTEGFFQKNRIDLELLAEYGKGIIATTGCPSGEIQTRLRLGQKEEAYTFAGKLQDALGKENVFLELMEHGMKSDLERGVRGDLLELAKKLNIPLLATNDVHYTTQNQAHSHEEFLCVQTRSVMSTPPDHAGGTRFAFEGTSYYLKTAQEMADLFPDLPEALNNTLLIAERSNITIEPDSTLRPKIGTPHGLTEHEYLKQEAITGLARRAPDKANKQEYIDRLETEINILQMKDYVGYFLVVSDFVRWAKNNNVPTGHGRGCLSGDSQILTPQGFKKLRNIQPGDTVFDEKGNQVVIPNKMEYNCDEDLIHIKSYYGGNGNKMTADHKVLISKANPETNKSKLSQGNRYKKELNPVEWVRADEVKKGDYVVIPRLKFETTTKGWKIDKTSTSVANHKDGRVSRNSLSRETGFSRRAVSNFLNGEKVPETTKTILTNTIKKHGVTVEEIIKTNSPTVSETKTNYIKTSYDAGVLFGLFISDGWLLSSGRATVGFAQRRSEDEGYIPNIINNVFGITPTHQNHNKSDLRQYFIHHKGIHKLFQTLFPDYQFNATTKYIPEEFYNTSEEFRRGLLEGLWYGDGSHIGKTKYSTRSLRLAQGVHTLLLSLGLPAGIKATQRHEKRKGYGAAETTEYSVTTAPHFNTENPNPSVTFRTDENFIYYRVRETQHVPPEGKVYDFTVPTTNSYVTDSYIVHNSAGGSLVAYCLDITDIDPIKYNLLFERFINPERDSPPDIDMDFNDTDRERVIEYVREKYGIEQVAQIATFGKIGAKAAIKDSIRIKEMPYATGEALSKALPEPVAGKAITLKEVYDPNADRYPEAGEFRDLVKKIDAENVIETAKNFEGRTRSTGVHAAALVISSKPVVESVPMMQRQNDGAMITQWDYPTCEHLGLLKVDFLGLRNLGIIANTIKHIQKTRGETIDMYKIIDSDMDDPKTYQLLAKGDSNGVFQLDSAGMQSLMKQLKPTEFNDIAALLALYRPGPMGVGAHVDYALRKNGEQKVTPIHPELEEPLKDILNETFSIIAYQEQIMLIAQKVANYTLAQADNLRRAMGKKKKSVLDAEYVPFSEGMRKNGYSEEAIKDLWDILIPFADYGFNKSHSIGYGMLSYLTAYFKANYPAEFMSALLSSVADDSDRTALYLNDCRNMGITVDPPNINESNVDYEPASANHIHFGFKAIRGVGVGVAEEIVAVRGNRPFKDFNDFVSRIPKTVANKRILEALALGGAFDSLGVSRKSVVEHVPELLKELTKIHKKTAKAVDEVSLFDLTDEFNVFVPDVGEWGKLEKLKKERHALGLYVSGHPLEGLDMSTAGGTKIVDLTSGAIPPMQGWIPKDARPLKISGIVTALSKKRTKKGETFALGTVEDLSGTIPFVMFPKAFKDFGEFLQLDGVYQLSGFHRERDIDGISFTVDALRPLEFSETGKLSFRVKLTEKQYNAAKHVLLEKLKKYEAHGEGATNVIVSVKNEAGDVWEEQLDIMVKGSPVLSQEVREVFGMLSIGRWRKSD